MFSKLKWLLLFSVFLSSSSFAQEIKHGNGFGFIVTGKVSKLDTDEEYIKKFSKAFGKKMEAISDKKMAPKISKLDGSPVAYILRDPGKPRGERPARRKTSIAAYNQKIPQKIKDIAIAEFSASEDDFKTFPLGFKLKVSERRNKKFTARFYLYRTEEKRKNRIEMIALGDDIKLAMPKGVFKFTSKDKPKIKGAKYTLWGRGKVASMTAELDKSLKDAGFETKAKNDAEEGSITFVKGEVDGRIGLTQTTTKDPSVNLVMLVKSSKCKPALNLGSAALYSDALNYKCE